MRGLLDTHILLWWLTEPRRLSGTQYEAIASERQDLAVSSVSIAEIAIKTSIGKLAVIDGLTEVVARQGFRELPFAHRHALELATLPLLHRDPFDRMLVAQCIADDLVLITGDRRLSAYPVTTIT